MCNLQRRDVIRSEYQRSSCLSASPAFSVWYRTWPPKLSVAFGDVATPFHSLVIPRPLLALSGSGSAALSQNTRLLKESGWMGISALHF